MMIISQMVPALQQLYLDGLLLACDACIQSGTAGEFKFDSRKLMFWMVFTLWKREAPPSAMTMAVTAMAQTAAMATRPPVQSPPRCVAATMALHRGIPQQKNADKVQNGLGLNIWRHVFVQVILLWSLDWSQFFGVTAGVMRKLFDQPSNLQACTTVAQANISRKGWL